jgi:hypothetical protein
MPRASPQHSIIHSSEPKREGRKPAVYTVLHYVLQPDLWIFLEDCRQLAVCTSSSTVALCMMACCCPRRLHTRWNFLRVDRLCHQRRMQLLDGAPFDAAASPSASPPRPRHDVSLDVCTTGSEKLGLTQRSIWCADIPPAGPAYGGPRDLRPAKERRSGPGRRVDHDVPS